VKSNRSDNQPVSGNPISKKPGGHLQRIAHGKVIHQDDQTVPLFENSFKLSYVSGFYKMTAGKHNKRQATRNPA
jgi:hypothetical protein